MEKGEKTFIVIGNHRSATSYVAGALHKYGVNMGDHLMGKGPGNPKGHFEDLDFLNQNEEILRKSDGWWNKVPDKLEYDDMERIEKLVNGKKGKGDWGWKDPRTSLTWELYEPYIEDPILVCMFRKPEKVAKSLTDRDGTNYENNLKLAKAYNRRIIEQLKKLML